MSYAELRAKLATLDRTGSDGLYAYTGYEYTELIISWADLDRLIEDAEGYLSYE